MDHQVAQRRAVEAMTLAARELERSSQRGCDSVLRGSMARLLDTLVLMLERASEEIDAYETLAGILAALATLAEVGAREMGISHGG